MSALRLNISSNRLASRISLTFNSFTGINRTLATSSQPAQKNKTETSDWVSIYKFRYIQSFSSANKLKVYQIGLTAILVPASFIISEATEGFEHLPVVSSILGISGLITLTAMSFAFRNTVGFIYTSKKDPALVKFAYMDFWGRRKDEIMEIGDVKPFTELPKSPIDNYCTSLQFYSGRDKLKLMYKFGGVSNTEEFSRVFGLEK